MDILFHTVRNTSDETLMGHKLWFPAVKGCDAVSATANASGFTPLIAVARYFEWDYGMMKAAASACNEKGEIAILTEVKPTLFLVPATKGRGNAAFLIKDLLRAVSKVGVRGLHFTHFGFLQGPFPGAEIAAILDVILDPKLPTFLERLVFDIDERKRAQLHNLMRPKP